LTELGKIAEDEIANLPQHYSGNVTVLYSVVMPDHIHILLELINVFVGAGLDPPAKCPTIPQIIGSYKSGTTRRCNQRSNGSFAWQRGYYERVVRDDAEYCALAQYIEENPRNWDNDKQQ
jgi:REP element-mobilizing transposase RayT